MLYYAIATNLDESNVMNFSSGNEVTLYFIDVHFDASTTDSF